MSTLSEGYAYYMLSLFLGYLNSKQIQKLFNKLFPVPFSYVKSILVLCEGYLFSMNFLNRLTMRSSISFQKLSKLYV